MTRTSLFVAALLCSSALAQPADREAALRKQLKTGDVPQRAQAAERLGQLQEVSAEAIDELAAALGDEYWDVRKAAARALGAIGPAAVQPLRKALGSENYFVPRNAAMALGLMESAAEPAVVDLAAMLDSDDEQTRLWGAWALSRVGPAAALAGDALVASATKHPDGYATRYVMIALGRLAASDEKALQAVMAALQRGTTGSAEAAAAAGKAALPHLVKMVEASDAKASWAAIEIIGQMESDAAGAVELLAARLYKPRDQWFQAHVASTLGRIGPAAAKAADALVHVALNSDYTDARISAVRSLGRIGADTEPVRKALAECAASQDAALKAAASLALEQLKAKP